MHGGKSRRGIAHPNYQTGRYAKDLPPKLAEQYQASLESKALTSLREDLGLCDIHISRISLKATTSEGMGFVGRGEGLVALATASIEVLRGGN